MGCPDSADTASAVTHSRPRAPQTAMAEEGRLLLPPAAEPHRADARRVRCLTLDDGEHRDSTLYSFEKGDYIRFHPGPSLLGRKVYLYTNYVVTSDEEPEPEFVRSQYYLLEWRRGECGEAAGGPVADTDVYCELRLARPGPYHYYWLYETGSPGLGPAGSGWWQVSPAVEARALCCQTVLAKCLGPLPRWEAVLRQAYEAGYNMIHFTPIQELGASNSSYSLANQLRLNPAFGADGREPTFADVENILINMRRDWKMLSICDIVLNHTANETPWLLEHPEASYNCANTPRLRPAALLDGSLARLTRAVGRGELVQRGVPCAVTSHHHVEALREVLHAEAAALRLWELSACDVPALRDRFTALARNRVPGVTKEIENIDKVKEKEAIRQEGQSEAEAGGESEREEELRLVQDPQFRRLRSTVDMELALRLYNLYREGSPSEEARVAACAAQFAAALEALNAAVRSETEGHLRAAVDNCLAGMRYFRLQADGPRHQLVSDEQPLVPRYFTWAAGTLDSADATEVAVLGEGAARVMAHNGWVMGADPLADFALVGHVYLRRELIAWGDSVKLRYGAGPEESPFLWSHMRAYVELTAELFDGVRLDNCHSTPPHVAAAMLDAARALRPDLFVVAELFTDSDTLDNLFVNRLGINALIRESMSAGDARELGRLVHRFGGPGVGTLLPRSREPAAELVAPALILEQTHDNEALCARHGPRHTLPVAALLAAAAAPVGSARGSDELVPHHIHVVEEDRLYPAWSEAEGRRGLVAAKRELNLLHRRLAREGYDEMYVDQMSEHAVAVTRHNPRTRQSVIVVAQTAFNSLGECAPPPPLRFEGQLDAVLLEAEMLHDAESGEWSRDPRYITGLPAWSARVALTPAPTACTLLEPARVDGTHTELRFTRGAPGSVVVLQVSLWADARAAVAELWRSALLAPEQLAPALAGLSLAQLNAALYRAAGEERAAGGGPYAVPGLGELVYAGAAGAAHELQRRPALGHPLLEHLRAGDWLPEYTWRRLERLAGLAPLAAWYRAALRPLARLPRYLVPAYADALLLRAYHALEAAALARMSPWVQAGCAATRALALTSVQLLGCAPDAGLPPPAPPTAPSLSAGLPHFATGYMRVWGRDTFISLRGLMLLTGRYEDARNHIVSFGACLRHGLVPNLLAGGPGARYNCRDAAWWWLLAVQQYVNEAPHGPAILQQRIPRLFPSDDAPAAVSAAAAVEQPLCDVIQEMLDRHFQGIAFVERGAGRGIDAHMAQEGFTVQAGIDPETGFPFGGSQHNCGTWMDKMGSSEAAGTRGRPATPRDGSAVELVALAHSAARWLDTAHRAGHYPHAGMTRKHRDGSLTSWRWAAWAERLERHFERHFWVGDGTADPRPDLLHRRYIYKDSYGASQPWADYQLRCNFAVAMSVSPTLFDAGHARAALDVVERELAGPLGLRTLDPSDWAYCGDYDNDNNSTDPKVAHGFNYHQGPEWVWPMGSFLRARLVLAARGTERAAAAWARRRLGPLVAALHAEPWRGLPELTNRDGALCRHACRSQAWSSATVLEVLYELSEMERARLLTAAD